jgi:D-alanine-D-alanine ligase
MDIIVLCGGLSTERDVSIASGTLVRKALGSRGHNAVLVDLFTGYRGSYCDPKDIFKNGAADEDFVISETAPDLEKIRAERGGESRIGENIFDICAASDMVFMALHGQDGEDGKVQAAFDLTGIKYTGTGALGSALAMNKDISKKLLVQNDILTAPGITINVNDAEYGNVGFPCVVKPCSGGSSVGISIVDSERGYDDALKLAFRYDDDVIVEKFISGRECSVGVIDGRALPVIEICPKTGFYDYKNKYQSGNTIEICPADFSGEVTRKLRSAAEKTYKALKVQVYGRMDFIVDENGDPWCLEGNTLPGMTNTSLLPQEAAADGISYEDLCELIIELSFKKYR